MNLVRLNQYPRFSNFFNTYERELLNQSCEDHTAQPAVNIKEDDKQFVMEMAIPGYSKKDFKINLEDQLLNISSEKENKSAEDKKNYTRKEFSYQGFSRSFRLPKTIISDDIKAEYKNGMLTLVLPKKEEVKLQREISIA